MALDETNVRELGYVSTEEACEILGRSGGGTVPKQFIKAGVRSVEIISSRGTRRRFWMKDDLRNVPPPKRIATCVNNRETAFDSESNYSENSGLLMWVQSIENRIRKLESFVSQFD